MFSRLYLHIPFCRSKCPYCAFVSQASHGEPAGYADLLLEELALALRCHIPVGPLESVYFGGGTPSLLAPADVARLMAMIKETCGLADSAEVTLEANPGTVDRDRLSDFRKAGVNRLSLGVQSFEDRLLATLGRIHTAGQVRDAFAAARAEGFATIGIDLIHALPGQTLKMWHTDLKQALGLAPEHISVYGLTVEAGTPFGELYPDESSLLPDDDLSADMFELADDLLTGQGYEHYEIANYARPGLQSRHNSGYWHRDGYLGLGAGAHSLLRDSSFGTRFGNEPDLDVYTEAVRQGRLPRRDVTVLARGDAMAEFMFLGLRLSEGVAFDRFEQEFGVAPEELYGPVFRELSGQGLLEVDEARVCLTRRGMLLSNRVFSKFLP